jgi:hypothetical protein
MGDKGGKKDKEKNKQQQLTKQKQEGQKKHDNAPAKNPQREPRKADSWARRTGLISRFATRVSKLVGA